MKFTMTGAAMLLISTAPVLAGGIERGNQMLGVLFEQGNYAELSFGHVKPTVEGTELDLLTPIGVLPGGTPIGNVASSYNQIGLAYKHQFNENWSAAVILDQPFGADLLYPTPEGAAGATSRLGGTLVDVESTHLTGLVRYAMPQNGFGVHGGIRVARAKGEVGLSGLAYGAVSGYNVQLDTNTAAGWVAGASWERPEIAARVALTFNSEIEHDFDTVETGPLIDPDGAGPLPALPLLAGTSTTTVNTPKSVNLEFQTGVAPDTLVFGSIRWVDWSSFEVNPERFVAVTGGGLVELEDTTTYMIGVGRKFTDNWSGAASFTFEKAGDDLVSPLAPTNGRKGITLAAIYTTGNMKITTGINYSKLGDATPETGTPDVARASMRDNSLWGIGVKVGYSF
ncbi:OmpP1/FadL family transporter [Paracoccus spongiarum]|uniref:Outer membrane protein transport protein n=1 Tax=Paracoccus spongiarum TaxID=3064387 RepID=A0ABT9J6R3_9RHOB|nr:outer membrane protein transport protein [Paracoccus sp. 2205BS29-5]MDP5305482.1 outer membrane protein transport protein [Paracoccus sp. 2205BS29-5]